MRLSFPLPSTFLALPLEQDAQWRFQEVQESLKEYGSILMFQNPQTPHLTLTYWPSVMQIEYDHILVQAKKISAKTISFSLRIIGADTFGKKGDDHVLYLVPSFSDELARLKKMCPWPNEHPFVPHITLARIGHPQKFAVVKKKIMKALSGVTFDASFDRLRLYAEVEGKHQTPLEDFPFQS